MVTLAQLYERLILDTNRDDMAAGGELEQAKIDAVSAAINKHKAEQFWFNAASGTANTSAGEATLTKPGAVFVPNLVSYSGEPLQRFPLIAIEHRTETGLPSKWADNQGLIRLWPIPDKGYAL